jgi:hypothetical protein
MQHSRSRKRKKKVLIKQVRSKIKYNNQFNTYLIKIQIEVIQDVEEVVVSELIFPISKVFFGVFLEAILNSSIDHT